SSDTQDLANRILAFVGNDSLLDFLDYGRNPPFDPTFKGGGSYVPDLGGLAFSYGRAQSSWHAGVVGSVSPVLVGGGQFKPFTVYDSKFVRDAGDAALDVATFIPHVPLSESNNTTVRVYLDALKTVSGAVPSTFSIFGFTSGLMLIQALQPCAAAPTRKCLI